MQAVISIDELETSDRHLFGLSFDTEEEFDEYVESDYWMDSDIVHCEGISLQFNASSIHLPSNHVVTGKNAVTRFDTSEYPNHVKLIKKFLNDELEYDENHEVYQWEGWDSFHTSKQDMIAFRGGMGYSYGIHL
jgi:hypothetical protein